MIQTVSAATDAVFLYTYGHSGARDDLTVVIPVLIAGATSLLPISFYGEW